MQPGQPFDPAEYMGLLEWYRAAGVDLAVGEEPVNRFLAPKRSAEPARQRPAPETSRPAAPPGPRPPAAPGDAQSDPETARALAARATTLDELRETLDAFTGCGLKATATQLVFADGNPEADLMMIGEAPGRDEDLQGKPFVGRSGRLLDRMLAAIGLDRTGVYIANTIPWRPPGNRTPSPAEVGVCLPFLERQIALVAPKIIVTFGAPATSTVTGTQVSITRVRGQWREVTVGTHPVRVLPTFHPAFLLRQPAQKRNAWRDMLALRRALDTND